jgi:anaerobic ribonucleoside-triphosphate reductase activating protein
MRYAQIRKMDISNGCGIGVSLFTQGCRIHCKNCFNKEIWNYDGGNK